MVSDFDLLSCVLNCIKVLLAQSKESIISY